MFRENVLNNAELARRIARSTIPVAVNYEKVLDSTTEESRFLRPLMRQRDQEQGVWILSPEGQALGGFEGFGDMPNKMGKVLDAALKSFAAVPPRQAPAPRTHPFRGRGFLPDGSVCLAECVRRLDRDLYAHVRTPVISSVTLTAHEFEALSPKRALPGEEWNLPTEIARRFSRLSSPLCYQHAPQPDWVAEARITGRVRSVEGGVARVAYRGCISSAHRMGEAEPISAQQVVLEGEGLYDVEAKRLRSFLMVGEGKLVWREHPTQPAVFEALVEWELPAREGTPD